MKFTLELLGITVLSIYLSACSIDSQGKRAPFIDGQLYDVSCRILIDYNNQDGVPISTETIQTGQVCSNEAPDEQLLRESCDATVLANMNNIEMTYPGYTGMPFREPLSTEMAEGSCKLPFDTRIGNGAITSRTEPLVGNSSVNLLHDNSGHLLGENSLTNSSASVVNSHIKVGAELTLDWRHANTTALGDASFDRLNCNREMECDLVLRYLSLQINDFTLVQPTIFLPDVPVRDVHLYILNNYVTRVNSEGRFTIDGVSAIISGIVDDEEVDLLTSRDFAITGRFDNELHDENHASLALTLKMKEVNSEFTLVANVGFAINKFPSKLANGITKKMCLVGGADARYQQALVANCSSKAPHQVWSFEQEEDQFSLRQPFTNTCLNVEPAIQSFDDGSVVSIVECSGSHDQLWKISDDLRVIHTLTERCLDVGSKDRGGDNVVFVQTCNKESNSQIWSVFRPGDK